MTNSVSGEWCGVMPSSENGQVNNNFDSYRIKSMRGALVIGI